MKLCVIIAGLLLATAAAAQRGAGPAGSISGTLSSRDGTPAAGVRVSAVEAQAAVRGATVSMMAIAETDNNGRFRLDAVPPGRYFISAGPLDAATLFPGVQAETDAKVVEVGAGANLQGVDFRLVTVRFTGRILGQELPPPRQLPAIATISGLPGAIPNVRMTGSNRRTLTVPVTSDGNFEFPFLSPDIYQFGLNTTFGGSVQSMTLTIGDRDILDYPIVFPLVTVTGAVTIDDEAPLPRFQLIFSDNEQSGIVTAGVAAAMRAQVPTGVHRVTVRGLPSAYVVKSITAGVVDLTSAPLAVSAAGVPPIRIVLGVVGKPRWPTIRGRITGREFLDGVSFMVAASDGIGDPFADRLRLEASPITPVFFLDGSFEIPRLAPGRYILSAGGQQVDVTNGDVNDIVINVRASETTLFSGPDYGARVRGKIVGHAMAVPGATVRLTLSGGLESLTSPIFGDGSFDFPHVPPGVYQAEVMPRIPGAVPATVRVGSTDLSGVEVQVPATREIAGRVVVDKGGPLPRVLSLLVAGVEMPAQVQPDGRFMLTATEGQQLTVRPDSLPPGYAVRSMAYGALDLLTELLRFAATETNRLALTLESPTPAAVRGRVTGNPASLSPGHVWLTDNKRLLRTLESNVVRDGAFEFPSVVPGTYMLRFIAPGVPVGGETSITVTAGKDVEGVVLTASGAP